MQANVHVSMQSVYRESNQHQTELMLQSTTGQEEWLSLSVKSCVENQRDFFSLDPFITNTTGTTGRMIHQVTIYTFSNRNSERSNNTVKVTKANIFTPNKVKPDMNTVLLYCLHHITHWASSMMLWLCIKTRKQNRTFSAHFKNNLLCRIEISTSSSIYISMSIYINSICIRFLRGQTKMKLVWAPR